jgi:flavin reductase (DIM6/NTAB) family NADH-FMN oxidoreductase RutF
MGEKTDLKGGLMLAPVPVVLVACSHEELGLNVLTIAWTGVDCSKPPIIHVSIRPDRFSYRMIKESGSFTVNLPTRDMLEQVDTCGNITGAESDKFELTGLTPVPAKLVTAPIIAECPVNLECELVKIESIGLHDMFLGEIVARHVDASVSKNGRADWSKIPLISYVDGEYWSLGERIGIYGCSRKNI